MISYILDSDHLSLHQRGHEPLKIHLLSVPPDQVTITIISVEELLRGRLAQIRGAMKGEDRVTAYHWLFKTFEFLRDFTVLKYEASAEARFQTLRSGKIKTGTQDLKIASIALVHNATLVTRNRSDFANIPSLKIEDWSV